MTHTSTFQGRQVLAFAALVLLFLGLRGGLPPYDDAFFFVRFARNLFDHGVFAWNVEDGPVYGNTSQLFQGVVAAIHGVAGDHTVAATRWLLAGCLVGAVVALRGAPPALVLLASPVALATAVSGMETATVLLLGALLLAELRRTDPRDAVLVLLTVLLYLDRPDTGLLAVPTLALARRWRALGGALAGIAVCLGALALAYGTPVPLSFLTKSGLGGLYDEAFLALSRTAKLRHALLFAWVVAPFVRPHLLLVPAGAFVVYHLVGSVDVMGLHARFYAPALPWIAAAAADGWRGPVAGRGAGALAVWLAVGAVLVGAGAVPGDQGWAIGRIAAWTYLAYGVAVALVHAPIPGAPVAAVAAVGVGLVVAHPTRPEPPRPDDVYVQRLEEQVTSFRGLRRLARCLGPDVHVMHSEIGVPGMVLRGGRVTDLGGLMSPELVGGQLTVEALCQRDRPDAIFLPHRNYEALNEALREGECLRGYRRVVERGSSPLFVRADRVEAYRCR